MTSPSTTTSAAPKGRLVALVGAACASLLVTTVPKFEGTILRGYRDPIGVVTACSGHTATAVLGKPYTPQECETLLMQDLADHAVPVLKCTPGLTGKPYQLAAAVSFTFNVGAANYCGSTMARKFNSGDYMGACAEFPKWVYAGGKVLPGLVTRRNAERTMCETGLQK